MIALSANRFGWRLCQTSIGLECFMKDFHKIAREMPNLILEFLPAYSPDYNVAELVWHSAKEYLAHRLFESVEQLESLLHKLLNEGELIIKWGRKLKNKGNAVNAI